MPVCTLNSTQVFFSLKLSQNHFCSQKPPLKSPLVISQFKCVLSCRKPCQAWATSSFASAVRKTHFQRSKSQFPAPSHHLATDPLELHKPESDFAGVMQAVLLDVSLEIGRAADGSALRAAVRGLVSVDPLVSAVTALIGQHHLAHLTRLTRERLC